MNWREFIMGVADGTIIGACVALVVALVTVAGSIYNNSTNNRKGYKDVDSKIGSLDNTTLSGLINQKHNHMEDVFNHKIGELSNTTLSGQNLAILNRIKELNDTYEAAQREEALKRQLLTGHQESIVQSLSVLGSFQKELIDLQNEKLALIKLVDELKQENKKLLVQIAELEEQVGIETEIELKF